MKKPEKVNMKLPVKITKPFLFLRFVLFSVSCFHGDAMEILVEGGLSKQITIGHCRLSH